MKCPCKDCICVPMCVNKRWLQVLRCPYLQSYLASEGEAVKIGGVIGMYIEELKKRFLITRDKMNEIYFGHLESNNIEQWYKAYGGTKSVDSK